MLLLYLMHFIIFFFIFFQMHPALYLHISSLFNNVFTAFLKLAPIKTSISVNGEIHLILVSQGQKRKGLLEH